MAQDGCSDLQFDLAKQLLREDPDKGEGSVNIESHHQGINWLLRAANQGHEEAIVLLTDCYAARRGINESNEYEVRLVLEMSPTERAARKAARELFLCLSNGGEFISVSQLENKMREIYQMDDNNKNRRLGAASQQYLNHHSTSDILTEAHLITAAVDYSNGMLPNLNTALSVTTPHPASLNHIPSFYRPLFHPILFLTLLYHRLVGRLSALPDLLWQYKVPLMLLIYVLFAKEKELLLQLIPTGLYLLTIILMVITTFQMLKAKHEFIDFRLWSGLFQHFGGEVALYRESTETQFLRNNLRPYLYFFVALIGNLLLRPLAKHDFLPYSEITVIALTLAFITAVVFICSNYRNTSGETASQKLFPHIFILLSLVINVLAKYPYNMDHLMENSWQMFDSFLPDYSGHKAGVELRLNFRALFYLLIPILLVQIGSCDKWRGIYKYLIPHCVTLSWLQLGMSFAQDSTMMGLIRASVELLATLLFLPLVGLITMLLPILTTVEAFLIDQKVKIAAFIILATSLILIYGYLSSSRRWNKFLLPIQITLYSIAIFTYVVPLMEKNLKLLEENGALYEAADPPLSPSNDGLSWEQYSKYCQSHNRPNKIDTQLRCSLLDDEIVRWEGVVKGVQILRVRNYKKHLLSYVKPTMLRDILTCLLGDSNVINCGPQENCGYIQDWMEKSSGKWRCNLNKWNEYTYLLKMRMETGLMKSSSSVLLVAQHEFGNFTRQLQANDRIWFEGALKGRFLESGDELEFFPAEEPLIQLLSVGCLSCHNPDIKYNADTGGGFRVTNAWTALQTSIKYLLNVLFNPVLIFK